MSDSDSSLPPLYAHWMDQCLGSPIPAETEATCLDCAMCLQGERNRSEFVFHQRTKCCTYMPDLPNYLVGRIYLDRDPAFARGRAAFQAQLFKGLIVTPLGMFPPPDFAEQYKQNTKRFGRDPNLRCPYYLEEEGGLCGIWKHRNSRCATWFCRFVRGSVGVIFWKYLDQLLTGLEKALSRWCVQQLDIGAPAMQKLFPPPPSERQLNDMPLMWGKWLGRERQFYEECARLVDALTWQEVYAIGGSEIHLFAKLVQQAFTDLISQNLPEQVKIGNWKKAVHLERGMVRAWTYNVYDPIDLPKALVESLPSLNGCAVSEVLLRPGIDPAFLRKLIDFGVLIPDEG